MQTAPTRPREADSLAALQALEVLDSAAEAEFDALVSVASAVCGVPISLISLVDAERQWFKAQTGLPDVTQTSRDVAFCAHAVLGDGLFEIPDAALDPRFADNPLVTGDPGIRFYAGVPLRLSSGLSVGTLCVIDRRPRQLDELQRRVLGQLSLAAARLLEGRAALRHSELTARLHAEAEALLRIVVERAPSMLAYWHRDLTCRFANRAYERWFGVQPDALVGSPIRALLGEALYAENLPYIEAVLRGQPQTFERLIQGSDGVLRAGLARYVPDTVDGAVVGFVVEVSDVTQLKASQSALLAEMVERDHRQQQLLQATDELQQAQRLGQIGSWEWRVGPDAATVSPELRRIFGLDPARPAPNDAEFIGLFADEGQVRLRAARDHLLRTGEPYLLEVEFRRPDGSAGWLEARGAAVHDAQGRVTVLRGTVQDVTDRRRLLAQLAEQHELLRVTLQSIGDAVITTSPAALVTWLNPAAERMTGWRAGEALGRPLAQVFHIVNEQTRAVIDNPVATCLAHGKIVGLANHTLLISRDGLEFGIEDSAAPIRDEQGRVLGVVLVFHDVSEQRRLSGEMTYRATHDALTGLVNRAEFDLRLQRTLEKAREDQSEHALLYIDLDQFKLVNDACGHTVGDQLLQQVGKLLADVVRTRDTLARLGGDEFAVILEYCTAAQSLRVAQKICDGMDEFRFVHEERRFRIGTSIGLVPLDQRWDSTSALLQAADTSCYAAKEAGRNRVHVWFDSDAAMRARHSELQWTSRIERALDDDGLVLFAQRIEPLARPQAGLHAEILLRLRNDDGSLAEPASFLPAAERFHLITRVDRWVLQRAVQWLAALQPDDPVDCLCINLSGQSVGDRAFHAWARELLVGAGPPVCRRLCLEITETAAVTNLADAAQFIEQVRAAQVRVALDDFGAGASSFGYLKSLPVDFLKIDGQFIRDLISNPLDDAAVRCFVDVARVVSVQTVAEFVEQPAVLARLREIGVDFAQGYLLHRPAPLASLLGADPAMAALRG